MTDEEFDELVEIEHKEFLKWLDEQNNLLDKPISEILEEAFFAGFEGGMSKVRLTETTCVNRLHHVEKELAEQKAQNEKIAELKAAHESDKKTISLIIKKGKELEEQIEKMKCCANCKHRERGDMSDTKKLWTMCSYVL